MASHDVRDMHRCTRGKRLGKGADRGDGSSCREGSRGASREDLSAADAVRGMQMATAGRTTLPLEWSDEMAYIVGLTATDGCLFTGRRKINFKSEDRQLVETYLSVLGRTNRVKRQPTRTDGVVYFTEFHDSRLYEWFRSVGLTPRKSLTLGGHRRAGCVLHPPSSRAHGWRRIGSELRAPPHREGAAELLVRALIGVLPLRE